jgi:6-pyruvoyl-tetrahydropterin synthase
MPTEETCLSLRLGFSGAHRVRFSEVYGSVHGHNYDITVRFCVSGRKDLVIDIDRVRHEIERLIDTLDGKYLKSSKEYVRDVGPNEYVEIPCIPEGVTGECVAWYILDYVRNVLSRLGVDGVFNVQVIVCDSPINCFEARFS